MKIISSILFALSLMLASPVFAKDHCNCTEECQKQCAKGEYKDCTCDSCDCKKGNNCSHGKCNKK